MGEQRLAEATRSRLSGSEVPALLRGEFKESGVAWLAAVVPIVVMHWSNYT
jgi:hypothetical protein